MHNWRFLLLAFVAVFQPIASFTQRDVDGRQRCDYRATSLLRDSGVQFHGAYRFTKPALWDRRLNQREDFREIRHNEVREDFNSPPQRHVERGDRIPTRLARFSRAEYRLTRDAAILRRETHRAQIRSDHRDDIGHQIFQTRQAAHDSRLNQRSDDERRISSRRSRTMELQREAQRNRGDDPEARRAREIRLTLDASDRVRDKVTGSITNARRIVRERTPMVDMRRSESRLRIEQNNDRDMEHTGDTELRSSLMTSARVKRAYENEEARMAKEDVRYSLDRKERRTQTRRNLDSENLNRNIRRKRDSILRETASNNRRIIRDSPVRNVNTRDLQPDNPLAIRREFGNRVLEKAQRENRNAQRDTGFIGAMSLLRDSRNTDRERSVETRRGVKDARGMQKIFRSVERATENRRKVHSLDRENEREVRNIAKDTRAIQLDRESTIKTRHFNRQSCSLNTDRSSERRENGMRSERTTKFSTERDAQSHKSSRNVQKDSRILILQRDADNQRASREVRRETPLGRDRITAGNIRKHFGNIRYMENKRSIENRRDTQSSESRSFAAENASRRDTRNSERRTLTVNNALNSRRDRDTRDANALNQKRSTRGSRTQKYFRAIRRETTPENRRSNLRIDRQSQTVEHHRIIDARRATTGNDARNYRSFRSERSVETQRNVRNRRERSAENRSGIRNIKNGFLGEEAKVESRKNTVRARDTLSLNRNSFRGIERLNTRDISIDSRRSRSVQRLSEMNNLEVERLEASYRFNTEVIRKHEFLSANGNSTENNTAMNWQYLFYMVQGVYLCWILMQLINEKRAKKKIRTQSWWSAPQHLVKVD